MIKSITPVITTFLLLGGSFLILAMPNWLAYVLLTSMATILIAHLAYKHSHTWSLVWHFFAEFIGFCFLVALFVGTVVLMNGLLSQA